MSMKMVPFTIRLDVIHDRQGDELMLSKFLSKYEKYLVYFEVSDEKQKEHFQGIVYVPDEKAGVAIKTRWSTVFKEWTRGQKSMAVVRKDNYSVYIAKDKNRILCKGYTDEEVADLESRSYKKDPDVAKRVLEERTKSTETTFMKAYKWCVDQGMTYHWDGWKICELLLDYYREHVKCEPNDFQLKCMTKSIYK